MAQMIDIPAWNWNYRVAYCCVFIEGMLGLSANLRYFVCCSWVDMRKGFDGLSGVVRNQLGHDPVSGSVFVFLNRRCTHIKLLYWDGDGFVIFYKRLERGRFKMPQGNVSTELKRESLLMLLEGLSFDQLKQGKRYKRP
jgi:transposase